MTPAWVGAGGVLVPVQADELVVDTLAVELAPELLEVEELDVKKLLGVKRLDVKKVLGEEALDINKVLESTVAVVFVFSMLDEFVGHSDEVGHYMRYCDGQYPYRSPGPDGVCQRCSAAGCARGGIASQGGRDGSSDGRSLIGRLGHI
ncbi:hypothetical protein LTR53_013119 [Teratosphaeriaceae sp. CCFEE 6253]|nr:hypothetical protein LTR53_013119 [Teratosphaeriaceae sp. CCFEE 6253]